MKQESGDGTEKTLHRNMLLPFSSIPSISEVNESLFSNKEKIPQKKGANKEAYSSSIIKI